MDNKEPEVMRMLHEIRERHYEERKHLSNEEWVKKIKEGSDRCMKEFGLKLPVRIRVVK